MTGFVSSGNMYIPTFYDPGSSVNGITTRMANKLGLTGIPISLNVDVFGREGELNFDSFIGRIHKTDVCGVITEITPKQNSIDLSGVAILFDIPKELI